MPRLRQQNEDGSMDISLGTETVAQHIQFLVLCQLIEQDMQENFSQDRVPTKQDFIKELKKAIIGKGTESLCSLEGKSFDERVVSKAIEKWKKFRFLQAINIDKILVRQGLLKLNQEKALSLRL